ncbi:MAG: hypothetical protein GY953_04305, partial [bacterium]|nr:hypothetical protein [bacterium]
MRNVPSLETIYRDYSPKGVQFIYIYKALAHPELDGYVKPLTLAERLMHIKEAKRTLGSEIIWICDAMDNRLKHAIGDAPNSEYLLDPDGKIASMRAWSSPADLRKDLEGLVGPVENPTLVADLGMKTAEPPKAAPTGVVERVKMPGQMRALKVEPQLASTKHPYYVKLRAEVGREVLRDGKGKMYLGFHLDPLYGVHWNNQVAPVQYELFPPDGVTISPAKGNGPKVEVEADADPREFLLDVEFAEGSPSVPLKFRYFACTDKMCIPVTQAYTVHFEADRDGGAAQRGPRRGPGGLGPGGGPPGDPARMVARMME